MAQESSSRELLEAVKQAESGGRRYKADGKTLLEGPPTKYGTAKGEMQVLDMTNRDPGFGVKPARDGSPDERARVGRDYLAAMTKRYGDTETGLIAYNWGPGNTDKWLKGGADPAKLPRETQKYVANITASLGGTKVAKAAPAKVTPTKVAVAKVTPTKVAKADVPERRTGAALLQAPLFSQLGANYQAALAVSMLADEAEKEDKDEDAPSEAEKMLAAMPSAPTPAAAPELELSYQSPFPEARAPAQPVGRGFLPMLRPVRMADGGDPKMEDKEALLEGVGQVRGADLPKGSPEEGEVALPDIGDAPAREELLRFFANRETAPGMGDVTMAGAGKSFQVGGGNLNISAALTSLNREEKRYLAKNLMASYMRNIGDATVGLNINKQLDIPDEVYQAALMGSLPIGGGRAMISAQGTRVNGQNYPVNQQIGYEYPIGSGQLSVSASRMKDIPKSDQYQLQYRMPIGRAKGSPEEGEVSYFQDPMGAPSAPVTKDTLAKGREFTAAEALRILRETGTGVARNVKNVVKGTTETPYNFFGAAADIGNLALTPLGLGSAEPFLGSAQLKRLATEAGIRPAPPTDPRDAGYYMMGEFGASAVNPAGVVRSGVKAATEGKKAAEMLAKDFQTYNQALGPAGVSYAVRNKNTPFKSVLIDPPDFDVRVDEPRNYAAGAVREAKAGITDLSETLKPEELMALRAGDPDLEKWFMNRVPSYLRKDFASPEDPFVKAADEGKLLHFENKPSKYDKGKQLDFNTRERVTFNRLSEGFSPEGEAKKDYGKRVETLIDASVSPARVEDLRFSEIPLSLRNADPSSRVSELATYIDETLEFPNLYTEMARMRNMGPTYSAYGQSAVKIPEDYFINSETLKGLTLPQASQRVAQFKNWRTENRQRMASKAILNNPELQNNRTILPNGSAAVYMPDLEKNPQFMELVKDVGCDGGWCTKEEVNALDFGSGNKQLHLLVNSEGRPMAQLTLEHKGGKPGTAAGNTEMTRRFFSFLDKTPEKSKAFYAHLHSAYLRAEAKGATISMQQYTVNTPEFKEYIRMYPSKVSISQIKNVGNREELRDNPAISDIQKYIQYIDADFNLDGIVGLKYTGLTELDPQLVINTWIRPLMSGANFLAGNKMYRMYKGNYSDSDFSTMRAMAAEDLRRKILRDNSGSKYFTTDEDGIKKIIQDAISDLGGDAPLQRAFGGMVERQVSTVRYI